LVGVVEAYRQRTYVEDVTYLEEKLGGTIIFITSLGIATLADNLKTDLEKGVTPVDLHLRD